MIHYSRTRQSLLTALVLLAAVCMCAAEWSDPAAQLAREIAGVTGAGTASITVGNASSLPGEQVRDIRRAIEAQLRSQGVRPVDPATGTAEIAITLSENVRGYLWVAEVRQGADRRVIMREVPRGQLAAPARSAAAVTLRRTPLWSQREPILDAAASNDHLLLLQGDGVSLFKASNGRWEPERTLPITHLRPWPRDLRGRLVLSREHLFDAYLPGIICTAAITDPVSMTCREGDDPWPLASPAAPQNAFFGGARNFFTGALSPGIGKQAAVEPFYAAAALQQPNYTLWIFTGTDGHVRQVDGLNEGVLAGTRELGSGIASVKSDCGTLLLATANGDGTTPDTVRAYTLADRELSAASLPLEFAGPITALWTAPDGSTVTAVARDLKTDDYAAFSLTVSCSQ
jgi:hypothetical protein